MPTTTTDPMTLADCERRIRDADGELSLRNGNVQVILNRAQDEERDLTPVEVSQLKEHRSALESTRAKVEALEEGHLSLQVQARARQIGEAIAQASGRTGDASLDEFGELLKSRRPGRVELRAATTANAGARTAVDSATGRPGYLYQAAGITLTPADSLRVESPYFGLLVARAATAEGATKPVQADPTLRESTLAAFAVTQDVSDQLIRFGVGLAVIGRRLESEVVFSVNAATADAFETEGGTPVVFADSASFMLDTGIALVESRTGNFPSLIVLNPADYPEIANKEGADSGEDIGSRVAFFNGVRLSANPSVTAGVAVVVDGRGWSAFGSPLLLDSMPDLSNNTVVARAEQYYVTVPHYAGSAVAVDIAGP